MSADRCTAATAFGYSHHLLFRREDGRFLCTAPNNQFWVIKLNTTR